MSSLMTSLEALKNRSNAMSRPEGTEESAVRLQSLTHFSPKLAASSSFDVSSRQTNFFRSCSVCVDGTVAMTYGEDRAIELYNLSSQISHNDTTLSPVRRFPQAESILGTLWYPSASPADPAAFCFLASIRECPVKLLDASDGRLRASYRIVDHRERHVAPHSMAFNCMTSKLYCGFQDAIEVFDINYPGEGERILTTPTKKSRSGLKGIISSLAFCPDYSELYAAGTFSSSVVLFAESSRAEIIQTLGGVIGPVTQVKFNPMQPHLLYATSRQSNCILSWDIRGDTSVPLQSFERLGLTNQCLSFDLDVCGKTLITGDQDGSISCFAIDGDVVEKPTLKFKGHDDAVAATVALPLDPMVVSVSGSRHFKEVSSESQSASSESDSSPVEFATRKRSRRPFSKDTSIKLWKFETHGDAVAT